MALAFGASLGLYLFSSANQYAFLQWNTGVRYLVPLVPLLFVVFVPVILRARPLVRFLLIAPTVVISWCVSMAREDVPTSLMHIFLGGFELPFLTVLRKTAAGYAPFLQDTGVSPVPLFVLLGVTLWFLWRNHWPAVVVSRSATTETETGRLTAIDGQDALAGNGHVDSLPSLRSHTG
jgi:hypothetical protein